VRLATVVALSSVLLAQPAAAPARPERLPQDIGAAGLDQALKKLKTTARLLHTTAHPDDEDGGMLAYESRGKGAEVMLFTLTRGDGGQNRTGSNLFDELGVLRTLELLESDRYYGVQQRFSRVADFGFTKNAEETFQKWGGHATALADMVRVIRTFRPDVVASGWSGTSRDGHGQHQAAGILTPEAVAAAADPNRFPEQIKEGLLPWKVKKLYARSRDEYTLRIDAGKVDPNLGTSYVQFGIEGYSHQKSQGATIFPARPGQNYRLYKLLESSVPKSGAEEQDFFDGIDTTLPGLAARLGTEEDKVPFLRGALKEIDAKVDEAISSRAAEPLLVAWARLREILPLIERSSLTRESKEELLLHLRTKSAQFQEAARLALGIDFHIIRKGASQLVVPGQTVRLRAKFENKGARSVALKQIELELPAGWKAPPVPTQPRVLKPGESEAVEFTLSIPPHAKLTRPYWHRDEPDKQNIHSIDDPQFVTLPFPPPPMRARSVYEVAGITGQLRTIAGAEVNGKLTPLAVVPAFSVLMQPATQILPIGKTSAMRADVIVRSNLDQKSNAVIRLTAPAAWTVQPKSQTVTFEGVGQEKVVHFVITPAAPTETHTRISAELESGGKKFVEGFSVVTHDDLDTFYYYQPAVQKISAVRVNLPENLKVGYIMGAGDDILPVLQQLGLHARLITAAELQSGDPSQFNTIVVGIRAYDARDDVGKYNQRLLDFVNAGGTLIVQNNTDSEWATNYAPYPLQLGRQRVSVEEAPVEILAPEDPVFNFPNKITPADFEHWIQERGVNFASQWDKRYRPLLASSDPGEEPLTGGLLRATVGKGTYIYTGYAFFRQLPAGVPGAIRLYVNLLSLGQKH
jgi:LmbE family N-acetylglucosaminyl deacetylase